MALLGAAPAAGASGTDPVRAGVPLLAPEAPAALPSDTEQVRIAMIENDTSVVVVSSAGGVAAPGVANAPAVKFVPAGSGVWTVWTASSCSGPWTEVGGAPVKTPVARPATAGKELVLCADNGTRLDVQGVIEGVYNSSGQARTVNTLPLEEYVPDVVAGEVYSVWATVGAPGPQGHAWGFQALEAQAVAARSYVLAAPSGWGGYATTCDLYCQYYRGTNLLTANDAAAAHDTAGEVMLMPNGAVATTEFSSSTGGYTSSSAEYSPFDPVPDAGDAVCVTPPPAGLWKTAVCNTNHTWTAAVALATIQAHWPQEGASPTVTVTGRNGFGTWGGRAIQLTISGNNASQTVAASTFAGSLGLKSDYFTITSPPAQPLHLVGHGWGHGVGMGQWGAFGYAIGTDGGQGPWTWQSIVTHYYAPATIASLPGSPTSTFTAFQRILGPTADATAAAELGHEFTSNAGHCPGTTPGTRPVVLATDANYPDALSSAPLARALATGTLLTPTAELSTATLTALRLEGVTKVVVVGGPLAVSTAVVTQLKATPAYACGGNTLLGTDISVSRIYGTTAYDTAETVATAASAIDGVGVMNLSGAYRGTNGSGGEGLYNDTSGQASAGPSAAGAIGTAVLATGQGFQDAMAASTLAYAQRLPVLLTTPQALSTQAKTALTSMHVRQVVLMGGPFAVSNAVVTTLEGLGVSVLRVAGVDDTDTSTQLARLETAASPTGAGWTGTGDLTVARGDFYTDGLAGAVVAAGGPSATSPEPVVLTVDPATVGHYLAAFVAQAGTAGLSGKKVTHFTVLGGPLAVTQQAMNVLGSDL